MVTKNMLFDSVDTRAEILADKDLEFIDWSERFPRETALQIAVRQSTFCLCGKSKDIGQASCGCKDSAQ